MRLTTTTLAFFACLMSLPLSSSLSEDGTTERGELATRELDFPVVDAFETQGFSGQLQIFPHSGNGAQVRIEGPEELLSSVTVEMAAGRLQLAGPDPSLQAGPSSLRIEGDVKITGAVASSVVIIGSGVSAKSLSRNAGLGRQVKVSVLVPQDVPLRLDRLTGTAKIGAFESSVDVDLAAADVEIAQARDASLHVSGAGSIAASKILGKLSVEIGGSGQVRVKDSELSELAVKLGGAGNVFVGGRADRAILEVSGSGDIHVLEVRERPQVSISGSGRVSLGNW